MNDFYSIMQNHSDEKLLEIVEKRRTDYQAEALAAAEQVLTERGLTWKVPENQVQQLTAMEMRTEINKRLQSGQNMAQIRESLRDQGIAAFDFVEKFEEKKEQSKTEAKKASGLKLLGAVIVVLAVFALLAFMNEIEQLEGFVLASVILAFLASLFGGVYLFVRKESV
jgi:cation transport ATPase